MSDADYIDRLCRYFGPKALELFGDPDVSEIYVNSDGLLRFYHHLRGRQSTGWSYEASSLRLMANAIADHHSVDLGPGCAELSAELPVGKFFGSRVQFQFPPVVGEVTFSIRKPPAQVYPLRSYLERGVITKEQHRILVSLVARQSNVLVIGATHSGKTTLLNALLAELARVRPSERVIALEDTLELQVSSEDHLVLRTDTKVNRITGKPTTLRVLVQHSLRNFPDCLVIGEIRDEAASALIEAWETGHSGYSTLHAADPEFALERLDHLCASPSPHQRRRIANAINHIVLIRNTPAGRRMESITRVEGVDGDGRFVLIPENEGGVGLACDPE